MYISHHRLLILSSLGHHYSFHSTVLFNRVYAVYSLRHTLPTQHTLIHFLFPIISSIHSTTKHKLSFYLTLSQNLSSFFHSSFLKPNFLVCTHNISLVGQTIIASSIWTWNPSQIWSVFICSYWFCISKFFDPLYNITHQKSTSHKPGK